MYMKWLQIGGSGRGDPVLDELYTHLVDATRDALA